MTVENENSNLKQYLGLDLSTQQLKAIVINDELTVLHHVNVRFDEELAEYRTKGGVYKNGDSASAPVNMWLKALDLCLDKLKLDGANFSLISGISGSAQQHGSVWWKLGSEYLLNNLDFDEFLHSQLISAFSLRNSPIWMDSTTKKQCDFMEKCVGGPLRMSEITGSRAYERFTGPQILKIFENSPEVYENTERICLISNFFASIFIGRYADLDAADASGMNLMNLETKEWSQDCLAACVSGDEGKFEALKYKLGEIVDTCTVIGKISSYFVERHGFDAECLVSSFTGDNPASMAGFCVAQDELLLSLGTSDTSIFQIQTPSPNKNGHILRNPLDKSSYMGLICFKNGSITRENIRDKCSKGSWDEFSTMLESVPRGNFGNIGFYFDIKEIYPAISGTFRFNKDNQQVISFADDIEIRACIEGQFLRLLYHSQQLGLDMSKISKVLVTGGASANKAILKVISDIFRLPIYCLSIPNSACLGAAYLAKCSSDLHKQQQQVSDNGLLINNYADMIKHSAAIDAKLVVEYINTRTSNVYDKLIERYSNLEERLSHQTTQ